MILVVDDEIEIANLIQEFLMFEGLEAICSTQPEVALQIVDQGGISCVITDLAMPRINGIELSRYLRELHPEVKIICVSGFTDMMLEDLENVNIDSFIQKPFHPRELLDCVEKLVRPKPLSTT